MTPERIEEIKRKINSFNATRTDMWEVLAALEEVEQQKLKYKTEAERLNEICKQLAGEEMLFQDGGYETEMQRLWNKLEEAQHTIARQREALISARGSFETVGLLQTPRDIETIAHNSIVCIDRVLEEGETQP